MKKAYYEAMPVEGCEQCELLTETFDDATACNECVEYGEALPTLRIVDIDDKEIENMNTIWIVKDQHGEVLDLCVDELTAYAVKKDAEAKYADFGITVHEHQLTTRKDVEQVIIFEPEDEGMDTFELTLERKVFDA